ncbi:hypothetical protein ACFV0C_18655 [Streptomyces sp. NPDC059568]|uniref:hypothetical protein n=1 Tax=Streptomyces sp. NPDC059568 TaxID=3346868 RepID=UPI0036B61D8E
MAAYLTYWLENVAVHHLRENTHTRYTTCVNRYLIPGLGKKKLTKLTAKDIRTWLNQPRTTCQCCTRGIDADRDQPRCCAAGACCSKRLSPLTLTYIHSVLKSALGLHWENFDLDAGTAAIRRTMQRTNRGGLTTLPPRPGPPNAALPSPPAASSR